MSLRHKVNLYIIALLASLSLAGCASNSSAPTESETPRYAGISVQLWSVKDSVSEDIKATLKQLSDMGFDGVELAGQFGEFADDPEGFKAYLDSLGLEISAAHVGFDQFTDERFDETVAFYGTLGVDKLIIPADGRAWSDDGIQEISEDLTEVSKRLAPYGMQVGYHNHHSEFDSYQGTTYWEYMAEHTPDSVLLQPDLAWIYFAGKEPLTYIKRYQDRIKTAHFKGQVTRYSEVKDQVEAANVQSWGEEMGIVFQYNQAQANSGAKQVPIIGRDAVDWEAIIEQFNQSEEPVWFVVEQEIYPNDIPPMEAVEQSLRGLQSLLQQ